jgi:hypothetical protein
MLMSLDALAINPLGIALATVAGMIVGAVWFQKFAFGGPWMRITGVDPTKPRRPALVYPLSFLSGAVTATVLSGTTALVHAAIGGGYFAVSVVVALALWLGLTFATSAVHQLFEGRPARLFLINTGHQFVTVVAMGLIIGTVGV